ncbi:hypothetical protein ACFQ9Q_27865 [Streptomyces virginiae]|uniref:hypothetical protein n=1 Tax=Streptomyces virginiae TaxID=1961 RepID=UPI00368C4271
MALAMRFTVISAPAKSRMKVVTQRQLRARGVLGSVAAWLGEGRAPAPERPEADGENGGCAEAAQGTVRLTALLAEQPPCAWSFSARLPFLGPVVTTPRRPE